MNSFCRFLSHGYSFTDKAGKLMIKPCCWFKEDVQYEDHDKVRPRWANAKTWLPGCSACEKLDNATGQSFRNASFDIIPDNMPDGAVALDISLDFNCNAACVICGPDSSSAWVQQIKKHSIQIYQRPEPLNHLVKILDEIDLSNVRRIKFFGGEPLLTDTHLTILKKIPNPELVDIWYTTNGSILPNNDAIDLWQKFKLVYMETSIDGIGDRFKYIRWPLAWDKIKNNLFEIKNIGPNNLLFRINHTLNPFNILYYNEVEDWMTSSFACNRLGDPTEINVHPCWGTWDLSRTPQALREEVYKKYSIDHAISKLLIDLPINSYDPIINFTSKWDKIRDIRWQSVFPEIVNYFP